MEFDFEIKNKEKLKFIIHHRANQIDLGFSNQDPSLYSVSKEENGHLFSNVTKELQPKKLNL
jgi:hypothetical protein